MPSSPLYANRSSLSLLGVARTKWGGGKCARWAGLGSRLGSKMAVVSGQSKCWSWVTQIGQLHRWSVSTMDGDDSTVTKLLGGSIQGRRDWSLPARWGCLGSFPPSSVLRLSGDGCRVPDIGWMLP